VVFAREDFANRGETRRHGCAVGVVGAAVKDFVLRDEIHHGTARSKRGERQTATDGFGQADDVRLDTKEFAGAAPGEFRTGFHLVENEQRTAFVAKIAQSFEKTRLWEAQANIHEDGLKNDGGNLARILLEAALDAREIVERGDDDVGERDRKSTRLNSSHVSISYAVFCLKKKKQTT